MIKEYIIYAIINRINGKIYIGYSANPKKRWEREKYASKDEKDNSYNTALSRAFRKYTIDNFSFEILEILNNKQEALKLEQIYIYLFATNCRKLKEANGYNETDGGEGTIGYKPTQELIQKRVASRIKHYKHSEETKQKISNSHIGIKPSQETLLKMSNSHIGLQAGENSGTAKLNWIKVDEIRQKYSTGEFSLRKLAKEYNVSDVQICNIVNNKQWIKK